MFHLMNTVACELCNKENHFPDDSKAYEKCGWCGAEIESGWSDCDDEDEDEDEEE